MKDWSWSPLPFYRQIRICFGGEGMANVMEVYVSLTGIPQNAIYLAVSRLVLGEMLHFSDICFWIIME